MDRKKCDVPFNVMSREECMLKIERWNRVVIDRCSYYCAMIHFDHLPRMIVAHFLIRVFFYINDFAWTKGASKIFPPLTIVEGVVLDVNFHFRDTHGELFQTCEGTCVTMSTHTVDAIALDPCGNVQGGFRCYSLVSGRVSQRKWKDSEVFKMLVSSIKCIKHIEKK